MEISQLKQQLNILTVLEHYGLAPDKNFRLLCPFHPDKTPSLQIFPKSNTFCCFSANCSARTGDAIQFIELMELQVGAVAGNPTSNRRKHQAILTAKKILGITTETENFHPNQQPTENNNLNSLFKKLQLNLAKSHKAQQYINDRHLCAPLGELTEGLRGLEIGFSATPVNTSLIKGFANCIIFPLKDKSGNIVSLYGRSITNETTGKHFYSSARNGLYPKYPKPETKKIILTESVIDAATLLQNVVISTEYEILALYGTNGLTLEHSEALSHLNKLEEVIIWLDGDQPGEKATDKYCKELAVNNYQLSIINCPKGEDINSLLQGHEPSILTHLINNRKPFLPNALETPEIKKKQSISSFFSFESGASTGNDNVESKTPESPNSIESEAPTSNETTEKNNMEIDLNTTNPEYITYKKNGLKFSLLGGISLQQTDRLRVTLKLNIEPQLSPLQSIRHNLDLYNDDLVEKFCRKAAEKLEISTSMILQAISELIEKLEQYRLSKLENQKDIKPKKKIISTQRRESVINYLKAPKLLKRTNADIAKTGVIGEEINRLLMFLVFTSRLREQPLHVICLGASGTGKTHLQEKIVELIPPEDVLDATALSDNALYYFGSSALKHKLIVIEDMDGAENVLYQLRELMSKKQLGKLVVIKNSKGNMQTVKVCTEGPICVTGTTTKEKIYEDNANRSLLLYLDGSKQHQEQIMDYQRKASAGQVNKQEEEELKELFKDIQRVLKPITVRNPFAPLLKIPQEVFKPLRTNTHYLQFIECITFYHQFQRELKIDSQTGEPYIETTLEDIAAANALLKDVLLAKADELSGECRRFFERLKFHLKNDAKQSFYAKDIRADFRMNPNNLKYYINQLVRYGFLKVIGGNRYKQGTEYEVVSYQEYQHLHDNVKNALDETLERIKEKMYVGNVDN